MTRNVMEWSESEKQKLLSAVSKAASNDDALYRAQKALPKRELSLDMVQKRLRDQGRTLGDIIAKNRPKVEAKKPEDRVRDDLVETRLRAELAESEEERREVMKQLDAALRQVEQMQTIKATKPPKAIISPKRVGAKQRRGCPFMACSDWHVEETVDPKKVNGLNEFNLEIADRRIDRMAEAYAWFLRDSRFDCREGIVWLGGDLFSGWIHEELKESGNLSPVQVVKWLTPRVVGMLRKILANCPTIETLHVWCNDGNHGRLTHKIRVQTRTENSLEWLMYHQIAAMMADEPRIRFNIAESDYLYAEVFGRTIVTFHGDSVRYAGGVGGILVPLLRGLNELRKYKPVDLAVLGHFHQRKDEQSIIVNGSMIGTTPYSMRNKFAPEPPAQTWTMFDSENFRSFSAPIWLK